MILFYKIDDVTGQSTIADTWFTHYSDPSSSIDVNTGKKCNVM